MQQNICNGCHKFIYNELGYDEKCVDAITAIEMIVDLYTQERQKNLKLQERVEFLSKLSGLMTSDTIL